MLYSLLSPLMCSPSGGGGGWAKRVIEHACQIQTDWEESKHDVLQHLHMIVKETRRKWVKNRDRILIEGPVVHLQLQRSVSILLNFTLSFAICLPGRVPVVLGWQLGVWLMHETVQDENWFECVKVMSRIKWIHEKSAGPEIFINSNDEWDKVKGISAGLKYFAVCIV